MSRALVLGSALLLAFLFTARWTVLLAPNHQLEYPTQFVSLAFRKTVMVLVLPLVALLPGVLGLLPQVRHRYLVSTRTRRPLGQTLLRMYGVVAGATFVVMAAGALIIILTAEFADVSYVAAPTSGTITLEQEKFTLGQIIVFGRGWFYLFFCVWLGLHGAIYAVLGLTCVLLVRNAVVGLLLPQILFTVVGFGMAVLGLEAFSPDTVLPFNLRQLPMWMPMVPFAVLVIIAGTSASWVVRHGDRLAKAQ